jgi:hypothetical protein
MPALVKRTSTISRDANKRRQQARGNGASTLERVQEDVIKTVGRKEELCVAALAKADEIDYHPRMIDDVRYIIDRIRDEREVEDMLRSAIHQKVLEDVEEALKAVDAIELSKAWSSLPKTDERAGLIPRCKLVYEQLTKYGDLMKMLADAMAVRSVERLTAAIKEAERLQMGTPENPAPEVEEAKAMIKMAEFEKASKQERRARREEAAKKGPDHIPEGMPPPSAEVLRSRRNLEVASVSPMLRAAVTAASVEKLNTAISQASARLDPEAAAESRELALAKAMLVEINASSADAESVARRMNVAMDMVGSGSMGEKQRELGVEDAFTRRMRYAHKQPAVGGGFWVYFDGRPGDYSTRTGMPMLQQPGWIAERLLIEEEAAAEAAAALGR